MNDGLKKFLLLPFNILYKINPAAEIKLLFWLKNKTKLNLKQPTTYLDKINWLKLFYRNDLMPLCADKYHARKYVKENGFGEYLPQLYWSGFEPKNIPWDELPNSFVIKVTSGSGGNIICRDKERLNKKKTECALRKWLNRKYFPCYGEWMYGKVKPRIIVEEFLVDKANIVPIDYKLFCFNGLNNDVGCIAVDLGRFVSHKRNIYDNEWNFLNYVSFGFDTSPDNIHPKPLQYDQMREIAQRLSAPFPHARIDFFVIEDRFYIGEITFFNGAGYDLITPVSYNKKMGEWIELPGVDK